MDGANDLRDRLIAMEARLDVPAPPELPQRRHRSLALSLGAAPILVLVLAATALGGAIVLQGNARAHPGMENPGQPFYGANLECMTPPQAAAAIAARGYTKVVWQVERDAPTVAGSEKRGSTSTQQPTAPDSGIVVPGAIVDGTVLMVVDQRQGAQPVGACAR